MSEKQPWYARAWAWLKKWGLALAAAVLVLAGAGWLWHRRERLLGQARDEAEVAKARLRMDALKAARKEIARQRGEYDEQVAEVDRDIDATRRHIVELHEGGEHLAGDDLEQAAAELGL